MSTLASVQNTSNTQFPAIQYQYCIWNMFLSVCFSPFLRMQGDYTPLGSAGSTGQHACCRIILDAGGEVNSRDSVRYYLTKHRWRILHHDNSAHVTDDEYWVLICLAGGIVYFSSHNFAVNYMIHLALLVYTSESAQCPRPSFFPCLKVD